LHRVLAQAQLEGWPLLIMEGITARCHALTGKQTNWIPEFVSDRR
jgi:hypothetical protein